MGTKMLFFLYTVTLPSLAMFSTIGVAIWLRSRRREREAYYNNETIKKLAESREGAASALEYLKEQQKISAKKRCEGLRLGGLILTAIGIGLMIFLYAFNHAEHDPDPDYLIGLIVLLIGAAMLVYTYWLAPKEDSREAS